MAKSTTFLDLPVDILLLIFPHLDAASFLALASTCKALHAAEFLHNATYWSALVRSDFRVPNQPIVQNDGQRWQKLYRRMSTQSKVFTWGSSGKGCLGHSYGQSMEPIRRPGPTRGGRMGPRFHQISRQKSHVSWPAEVDGLRGLGVISDIQCGGWSTTFLTSKGELFCVGVLDGQEWRMRGPAANLSQMQQEKTVPTILQFPAGLPPPRDRYDPATAVQQFSAGRAHVLALSDSGRIWSWQNIDSAGAAVKFLHHETRETGEHGKKSNVKKVVAGWSKSAALVEGTGIVLWEPLVSGDDETSVADTNLVLQSAVVPNTQHRKNYSKQTGGRFGDEEVVDNVGEVLNFILLEHLVIFNTSLGKIFAAQVTWNDETQSVGCPVEIQVTESLNEDTPSFVTDVQGSFRSFAVFTKSGAVFTSDQDHVEDVLRVEGQAEQPKLFKRIPALQNSGVISVAFGDYHFHALHSPGYITSYGREPQACGALGLGGNGDPEGRLRGIRYQGVGGDGSLVPHAYTEGRRIWFEKEKQYWIEFLTSGGVDPGEAMERMRMALGSPSITAQGETSEWIEQEGRDWQQKYGVQAEDDDGLGAYFALSVSAAGWHSGALVLVNEDIAEKVRKAVVVPAAEPQVAGDTITTDTNAGAPPRSETARNQSLIINATDWARSYLGMASSGGPSQDGNLAQPGQQHSNRPDNPAQVASTNHAEEGMPDYVWLHDHFPRLKLSDGTAMPGKVDFDEWRYEKPEFKLDWNEE